MTIVSRRLALAAAGSVAFAASAAGQSPADVVAVIERYAAALKAGNVETLVGLYAADGSFVRENMQPAIGTTALRAAYKEVFATLKVDLAFTVKEAETSGDLAWLRATSGGRIKFLATGRESEEAFNTLVVFRRVGDAWKIRSYLYASSKPGPRPPA
ncbi:MAG: nuclear transport factor 2 family protein [Enhydrobacter sp.]|nr:MAG: nuclear transport factor 2 family protein [Enhydrobacter sp.]